MMLALVVYGLAAVSNAYLLSRIADVGGIPYRVWVPISWSLIWPVTVIYLVVKTHQYCCGDQP